MAKYSSSKTTLALASAPSTLLNKGEKKKHKAKKPQVPSEEVPLVALLDASTADVLSRLEDPPDQILASPPWDTEATRSFFPHRGKQV